MGKTCGSVFKNPKNNWAGALIDKAGLKGFSIGGAKISECHGNFIVADSRATATDVYLLINHVKKEIWKKFAIQLQEEVEYVGEF